MLPWRNEVKRFENFNILLFLLPHSVRNVGKRLRGQTTTPIRTKKKNSRGNLFHLPSRVFLINGSFEKKNLISLCRLYQQSSLFFSFAGKCLKVSSTSAMGHFKGKKLSDVAAFYSERCDNFVQKKMKLPILIWFILCTLQWIGNWSSHFCLCAVDFFIPDKWKADKFVPVSRNAQNSSETSLT